MLLRAWQLSKRYGDFVALREVSFDVTQGEIVAVVGPNGAGKTTLVNALTGLYRPDSGDILFEGRSVLGLDPARLSLRGLVRSFQLVSVYPTLTVRQMISVGAFARSGRTFNLLRPVSRFDDDRTAVESIAEAFGLVDVLDMPCGALSQGQKKLVDIASVLALGPRMMLLDEPTSGISSSQKYEIMDRLLRAAKACGVESLLLVEHDMDLIARYATRVIALTAGEIVADMRPRTFFSDAEMLSKLVGKGPTHA